MSNENKELLVEVLKQLFPIKYEYYADIFISRLKGKTYEEIGNSYINKNTGRPITRERIRQIFDKITFVLLSYSQFHIDSCVKKEEEKVIDIVTNEKKEELLKTRLTDIEFETNNSRIQKCLSDAGIRTLGGLLRKSPNDLLEIQGFGHIGLSSVVTTLYNLSTKYNFVLSLKETYMTDTKLKVYDYHTGKELFDKIFSSHLEAIKYYSQYFAETITRPLIVIKPYE